MADPERLVRDALLGDPAVLSFFEDVGIMSVPQSVRPPYAIITLISAIHDPALLGVDSLPTANIDVDVVAKTLAELSLARGHVRAALDDFSSDAVPLCRLREHRVLYDPKTDFPRAVMSFRLSFKEIQA